MSRHAVTPLALLEAKQEFVTRVKTVPNFRAYVRACFSASRRVDGDWAERFAGMTVNSFELGEAYRVTADMSDLISFAASRLDETDKVDRDLAPGPRGVVRFERPLAIQDVRGQEMLVHWLTWCPVTYHMESPLTGQPVERVGVFVTTWNDAFVEKDAVWDDWMRTLGAPKHRAGAQRDVGRWAFVGSDLMQQGRSLGPATLRLDEEGLAALAEDDEKYEVVGLESKPVVGTHTNVGRLVHALWLLLGQTITETSEDRVPNSGRGVLRRMTIPPRVTVVRLRRKQTRHDPAAESRVEWQHRWMVRGHWRWQRYAGGRVERIWIAPFVKGPEGAPFLQSTKVYDLSR